MRIYYFSIKFITGGMFFQSIFLEPSRQWIAHRNRAQRMQILEKQLYPFYPGAHILPSQTLPDYNSNAIG